LLIRVCDKVVLSTSPLFNMTIKLRKQLR